MLSGGRTRYSDFCPNTSRIRPGIVVFNGTPNKATQSIVLQQLMKNSDTTLLLFASSLDSDRDEDKQAIAGGRPRSRTRVESALRYLPDHVAQADHSADIVQYHLELVDLLARLSTPLPRSSRVF